MTLELQGPGVAAQCLPKDFTKVGAGFDFGATSAQKGSIDGKAHVSSNLHIHIHIGIPPGR